MLPLNILIIFPFEWIAYSTPVLNLVELLQKKHRVRVLSSGGCWSQSAGLDTKIYKSLRISSQCGGAPTAVGTFVAGLFNHYKLPYSRYPASQVDKMLALLAEMSGERPDIVIATDSLGLLLASSVFSSVVYLSLELCRDEYFAMSDKSIISCVVTQSHKRFQYHFGDRDLQRFVFPNAQILRRLSPKVPRARNKRLVYFGNFVRTHGLFLLLDILKFLPEDYSLTLTGIVGEPRQWLKANCIEQLNAGRIVMDRNYIAPSDVAEYLSQFEIGFCFYDLELIEKRLQMEGSDFSLFRAETDQIRELYTATKIFDYFSAGIPIVGSELLSMKPVTDFGCGILLKDPTPETIAEAVLTIESNYDLYSEGCLRAAEALNLSLLAEPFIDDFLGSRNPSHLVPRRCFVRTRFVINTFSKLRRSRKEMFMFLRERIAKIGQELGRRPVTVYGEKSHTDFLMKKTSLSKLNITRFIQNDALETLDGVAEVLVSSYESQNEISKSIRERYGSAVRIFEIYPTVNHPRSA